MKKELKKYRIIARLHRLSDYDDPMDRVIERREYYRCGVSEKQVISRLKRTENLKSHDNYYGSVCYEWRFEITEVDPNTDKPKSGYEQLSLFNMEN